MCIHNDDLALVCSANSVGRKRMTDDQDRHGHRRIRRRRAHSSREEGLTRREVGREVLAGAIALTGVGSLVGFAGYDLWHSQDAHEPAPGSFMGDVKKIGAATHDGALTELTGQQSGKAAEFKESLERIMKAPEIARIAERQKNTDGVAVIQPELGSGYALVVDPHKETVATFQIPKVGMMGAVVRLEEWTLSIPAPLFIHKSGNILGSGITLADRDTITESSKHALGKAPIAPPTPPSASPGPTTPAPVSPVKMTR
jgi:hypothetical protein